MAADQISQLHQAMIQQQVVIVLSALLSLAGTVLTIVRNSRRQPPLDREMYAAIQGFIREYPTKSEMGECGRRHDKSIQDIRDELKHLADATRESLKDAYNRIEAHRESTNVALRDIERDIIRGRKS